MGKRNTTKCLLCGEKPERSSYTYCSNKCQLEYQRQLYIKKWKSGEISGLQGLGIVSQCVKTYLRRKYGNKCCVCGWASVNPKTGIVPLVADHIDGNWRNNKESNLRLICPNCDALSSTYAGLNRGKSNRPRRLSKRAQEGKLFKYKPK